MADPVDPLWAVKKILADFEPSEKAELARFLTMVPAQAQAPGGGRRTVRQEYRRCYGRACSTCDAGGKHGPYLYEVWREGARVRRRYLRRGAA